MAKANLRTAGGLAKAGAKKAFLSAAAPYIAVGVAIVVAVAAIIVAITSLAGGTVAEVQRIGSVAAATGGVKPEDETTIRPIANSYGIPWTILAALPIAEAQTGAEPGYNGPYAIKAGTPGISDADAKLMGPAATFIAKRMRGQIVAGTLRSGVKYHQDSLTTGANQDADGTLTYATSSPDVVKASAATKVVFVGALVSLPVSNATQDFMGTVFDTAQAWALGKNLSCAGSSVGGTAPGVQINLPAGAVAGLTEAQTRNAALIYNAAISANMGERGAQIGISVALAESTLQNYANDGTSEDRGYFPEHRQLNDAERAVAKQSLAFPHDTVGHNLDSIGLFQQRPSANWGTPAELIDPAKSATIFFGRLAGVSGWKTSDTPWAAGQTVQGSPSSDGAIYHDQFTKALTIVAALKTSGTVGGAGSSTAPATPPVALTSAITSPATGPPATTPAVSTEAATTGAAVPATSAQFPYPLPATTGTTGKEEAVNSAGQVPSGHGVGTITFSKFAALGDDYDNFYITMRWGYAAYNFNGTSTGIDNTQYDWFAKGQGNGKPWMVLVTNPRTGKSIMAPVMEAGPGPWVGSAGHSSATDPTGVWKNPTRGTPVGYKGLVSGFPPKALEALGAVTGYIGQTGDSLIYQWSPDQNAKPGPTTLVAKADGTTGGTTGGTASGCTPCPTGAGGTDISGIAVGNIDGLKPEQLANAQTIAKVALSRGLGEHGVLIGIVTAMAESSLINVGHGDAMGPSSIGLFQQMGSWGPLSVRTDPAGAAGLFYDAMVQVPSWQTIEPWVVAQSVEQSEFKAGYTGEGSDGTVGYNYHKLIATAQSYTTSLMTGATGAAAAPTTGATTPAAGTTPASTLAATGSAAPTTGAQTISDPTGRMTGCSGAGGSQTVISNGPNITLPNNPNIAQQLRGKVIKAPTTQVAAGLVWALQNTLGVPYIYGGGGLGSKNPGGPDDGMNRANGEENAGTGTGYDCSGLSWTVLFHMNPSLSIPDGNSGDMASGGTHVPYAQLLPGDLITFNGHVAVSLGTIDGVVVILEAPEPGKNVRILPMFRDDHHDWVSRYWAPGTSGPAPPAAPAAP